MSAVFAAPRSSQVSRLDTKRQFFDLSIQKNSLLFLGCQYIGFKCRNCAISCHEECLKSCDMSQDCLGSALGLSQEMDSSWNVASEPLIVPPLDTSYSLQSSSSCSTTPNSYYSQSQFGRNGPSFISGPFNRLDTDIGSACGKHLTLNPFVPLFAPC